MKFSMLTIAGALATANAASFRGDATATLKKMALMQKFTDAANKNLFGAARRLNDNNAYITDETVIQPKVCMTVKAYGVDGEGGGDGDNQNYGNSAYGPYISYLTYSGETSTNTGDYEYNFGADDEYVTLLSSYLAAVGSAWAEEKANLCDDCANMQNFCQMSDDEKAFYASMTEDEFTAYMETVEEEYQQKNQQNQQKQQQEQEQNNENQQQEQNNAYAAYAYGNGGRRNLYVALQNLCGTCEEQCVNNQNADDMQDYYEDMEELFENSMCTESGNGYYIGHTCGGSGLSVELAMFTDENCMYLAPDQNAYNAYQNAVANVYEYDADGDGQADNNYDEADLAMGYMQMVTDMFEDEFSCSVGAVRSYDGSDPSEACENLYGNAVSKKQCAYGGNNRGLQDEENYNYNYLPEGYDITYSEDLYDVCGKLFKIESQYAGSSGFVSGDWTNPFKGVSFSELFGYRQENGLSGGAIAGIVIAVVAVCGIAAAAFIKKKKDGKSDLEEPVFQGGALQ